MTDAYLAAIQRHEEESKRAYKAPDETSHFSTAAANDISIELTTEASTTNDTLIQALFIFHSEGEAACVSMFPQYGRAEIIKKLVEIICKEKKTGLLDNYDAEMLGKELLKMNKFDLQGKQIVDVAPLATLVNLTSLSLSDNQIVDVAPLATLVNLTQLYLHENQIVNAAPLATLVNLTKLFLHENQIVDVAPLATLVNLTYLSLDDNQIVDTTPLRLLSKRIFTIEGGGVVLRGGGCCTIV